MTAVKPWLTFRLEDSFVDTYRNLPVPWGHGELSLITYLRTYSRVMEDGKRERWVDTVRRVVEGTFTIQYNHIKEQHLPWSDRKARASAHVMFDMMFNMKFLPAGRGLWMMGTEYAHTRTTMGLFNCAFVSTKYMNEDFTKPFEFLMDVSMLGVGCGFDTLGATHCDVVLKAPNRGRYTIPYSIADTREGWVDALKMLINSYVNGTPPMHFNYSLIRPAGTPIKGFGGVAAGPDVLREFLADVEEVLMRYMGKRIDTEFIVDIMNIIGLCVKAGNVRRSAEVAIGDPTDVSFLDLKDYQKNPHRSRYGGMSNNTVWAYKGMDFSAPIEKTKLNGEPGYAFIESMRNYGRFKDGEQVGIDGRAMGSNPCVEQTLEHMEVCNLVEIFPTRCINMDELYLAAKCAYLYGKTVTLVKTHRPDTNSIILRNRRIGTSVSGIAMMIEERGLHNTMVQLDCLYEEIKRLDVVYSEWLAIPWSIKMTSVKPSGTVSLLAGVTSGMHYPISQYWFKNMRIDTSSPLTQYLRDRGYKIEPENVFNKDGTISQSTSTSVVSFPVKFNVSRSRSDVSLWEQMNILRLLQYYWADNQVSCTITYKDSEEHDLQRALEHFQFDIKNVSFLKLFCDYFPQMPEEPSTLTDIDMYKSCLSSDVDIEEYIDLDKSDAIGERGCSNDTCTIGG